MSRAEIKTEIKQTAAFTARNIKLFFKDKGMFIGALIAPLIIMMLYALFLHRVFVQSIEAVIPEGFALAPKTLSGFVAAYEISSVLAVCCVTVAFVANMNMVADRVNGTNADISVTPAKGRVIVLGYYFATAIVTLCICYIAMAVGFIYMAGMGWNMTVGETFAVILDVFLCVLFGTALSSVVAVFLKSRGAINAVSTIVSTVYGFICGAYYPISQFAKGIANFVMCLPGTYFTALFRSHFMRCFYEPFTEAGIPSDAAVEILDSLDVNAYFFGKAVPTWVMYTVALCTAVALLAAFVAINAVKIKRKPKPVAPAAE